MKNKQQACHFYKEGYPVVADDYMTIDFDSNHIPLIPRDFQVEGFHMNPEKLWV